MTISHKIYGYKIVRSPIGLLKMGLDRRGKIMPGAVIDSGFPPKRSELPLPTEEEYMDKSLMREVVLAFQDKYLKREGFHVKNIEPTKFYHTRFFFENAEGIEKEFGGATLLDKYKLERKLGGLLDLFEILGIEVEGEFKSKRKPELPTDAEFSNKTLMRAILFSQKYELVVGIQSKHKKIKPSKFPDTEFLFVCPDGTSKAFTGKLLIEKWGFENSAKLLAELGVKLEDIEPKEDYHWARSKFLLAAIELGKLPTEINVYDLKKRLFSLRGYAHLEDVLIFYNIEGYHWVEFLKVLIEKFNFTQEESQDCQKIIDKYKG